MNKTNVMGSRGNLATRQKGLSLMGVIIGIAVIGFCLIYGAKIGIIFLDQMSVKKAFKDSAAEMSTKENASVATFKSAVLRRISLDNITLDGNDMTVTKNGTAWSAEVTFIKDVPLGDKVKLVIDLSFTGEYGK